MSLPHFDVITFPGQILWVFIATGGSYIFNKFFFLPYLSNSIQKRKELILEYTQDIERMTEHAKSLKIEIEHLSGKARNESKAIIEAAMYSAQALLTNSIKNNNETIHSQATDYQKHIIKQREKLTEELPVIVNDVKKKLQLFIASPNN